MTDYIHVSNGDGVPVTAIVTTDRGIGSTNLIVDSVLNWATHGIAMSGAIDNDTGVITDKTVFKYHLEGSIIIIETFAAGYNDIGNLQNQVVVLKPTTEWGNEMADTVNNAVHKTDTTLVDTSFFLDEDTMASNSDTKVPSQQSVKAYVDKNNIYSASETDTGKKWVDGRTIYRKVVDATFNATNSNGITIPHGISGLTSSCLFISVTGGFAIGNTGNQMQQTFGYHENPSNNYMQLVAFNTTVLTVACAYGWGTSRIWAIMEYVK